jgi:hypothetical protein
MRDDAVLSGAPTKLRDAAFGNTLQHRIWWHHERKRIAVHESLYVFLSSELCISTD